jgi:integrase
VTRAKILKHVGWHTFRRTFLILLKANGEDIKVVQELLRTATIEMMLDVYAQAVTRPSVGVVEGGGDVEREIRGGEGVLLLDL